MADALISVPDDFPTGFDGTPAHPRAKKLGEVKGVTAAGANQEDEMIRRVDRAHRAIGMNVLAWSLQGDTKRIAAMGARPASKDEILREADVVSLNLRLIPETRAFMGRKEFSLTKRTAILINTARGALVERDALVEALRKGQIAGAGLDVFHDEPIKAGDPLLTLDNVVLSPHHAGQTPEVIRDGLLRAVENIENYLKGSPTDVVVAPVK